MTNLSRPISDRVARYVRGEMNAEEASQLEIELLDNEELFEEVQLQSALEQGLRTTSTESAEQAPWYRWLLAPRHAAIASIVVLAVALTIQTVRLERIENARQAGQWVQLGIPELVLANQRSTDTAASHHVLRYPEHLNSVRVKIDVATASQVSLSITDSKNNKQVYSNLSPEKDGYLHIDLITEHIKKDYTITITDETQSTQYQIELIPDRDDV